MALDVLPRPPVRLALPSGQFRLWRADAPLVSLTGDDTGELRCLLGDRRPVPVRGYGGWAQSERTGRRARSRFDGSETPAFEIALLLENYTVPSADGVEGKMRRLEKLAGWSAANDDPPPVVKWLANVPRDFGEAPRTEWVCENLEWGDSNSDDQGRLRWIAATLTLAIFRDSELSLPESKGFQRKPLHKTQDLRDFARKWLGDPKRWKDVAELNRDNPKCPRGPHGKPKRTVTLLVPPREPKSKSAKRGK